MKIKKPATAGTLESSDCLVTVEPSSSVDNLEIILTSTVEKQYGDEIKKVAKKTVEKLGVKGVSLEINDKGALDCVIKARVEAALYRGANIKEFDWGDYECQN